MAKKKKAVEKPIEERHRSAIPFKALDGNYHIIYSTSSMIADSKHYYGYHCTEDLNDGFLGSDKELNKEIRKQGRNQFKRLDMIFYSDAESAEHYLTEMLTRGDNEQPKSRGPYRVKKAVVVATQP